MKSLTLGLIATFALGSVAMADMNHHHHGHGNDMKHKGHDMHKEMKHDGHANHHMMKDGIHADGELHSIDGKTVNLSHGPIPAIGWPSMKMDLQLLEGAEVGDVKPGDEIMFMLEKGSDGMYGIKALMPKE